MKVLRQRTNAVQGRDIQVARCCKFAEWNKFCVCITGSSQFEKKSGQWSPSGSILEPILGPEIGSFLVNLRVIFKTSFGTLFGTLLGRFRVYFGTRSAQEGAKMRPRGPSRHSKTQTVPFANTFKTFQGLFTTPFECLDTASKTPSKHYENCLMKYWVSLVGGATAWLVCPSA